MNRARMNYAWFLRGIAKRLNDHANRVDPIKINAPIDNCTLLFPKRDHSQPIARVQLWPYHLRASRDVALDAIENARASLPKPTKPAPPMPAVRQPKDVA